MLNGRQLSRDNTNTLSSVLDGYVPGVWSWAQSPPSVVSSYASIRGASSFGLSYPKIYIDGIEVANPLLVTRFAVDADRSRRSDSRTAGFGALWNRRDQRRRQHRHAPRRHGCRRRARHASHIGGSRSERFAPASSRRITRSRSSLVPRPARRICTSPPGRRRLHSKRLQPRSRGDRRRSRHSRSIDVERHRALLHGGASASLSVVAAIAGLRLPRAATARSGIAAVVHRETQGILTIRSYQADHA